MGKLLVDNFNEDTVPHLMCRNYLSVDYKGYIFDCDFNQQLGLGILHREKLDFVNEESVKSEGSDLEKRNREERFVSVFDITSTDDIPKLAAHPSLFYQNQSTNSFPGTKAPQLQSQNLNKGESIKKRKKGGEGEEAMDVLLTDSIHFDSHCFGCTAGKGSSCAGAVL